MFRFDGYDCDRKDIGNPLSLRANNGCHKAYYFIEILRFDKSEYTFFFNKQPANKQPRAQIF